MVPDVPVSVFRRKGPGRGRPRRRKERTRGGVMSETMSG